MSLWVFVVVVASAASFGLAWIIRSNRAGIAEATTAARMQSLVEQAMQAEQQLLALTITHTALQTEHLTVASARAAAVAKAERLPEIESKVGEAQRLITEQASHIATLEADFANGQESLRQQHALLEDSRVTFKDSFKALSADALKSNNQAFMDLAKSAFETLQEGAKGDLDARKSEVDQIVAPIREQLAKVDTKLGEIELQRVESYSSLNTQLKGLLETHIPMLRSETANLVKALRQPTVRGRYGEVQLKRVVEMAGMLDHCDFKEQDHRATDDGRLRPDLIVKLPGGRNLVVDAKTPLSAYLEALEATDETRQKALLAQHAMQCRTHIAALSKKAYWDQFSPSPEFVVMFIPGEVFFSAALQEDPALLECGADKQVILATPTTLIALLRAVAYGWRQEKIGQNAEEVAKLGKELYERICTLAQNWSSVGDRLTKAVEAFNSSTATLETRVMVSARRFRELKVTPEGNELGIIKPIELQPRELQTEELGLKRSTSGDLVSIAKAGKSLGRWPTPSAASLGEISQ